MKKVIIAALTGFVAMFIWGGFSHLVVIAGVGFQPLPDEEKVIEAMKDAIPNQGLYFFPGRDFSDSSEEHEAAWMEKFQNGPAGIIVYRPIGGDPFSSGKLIRQSLAHFIVCIILSIVATHLTGTYWRKVGLICLLGAMACAAISTIYWNWYEFPTTFYLAQWFDQVVGFFLAGLLIARFTSTRMEA